MLLRFSVENFLSFKEKIEFSMAASGIRRFDDHVMKISDKRLLKGAFMFGANASGKSNFVKALSFMKEIVVEGESNNLIDKLYFRVDSEYKYKPGVFQIELAVDERFYSYGFVLSYLDNKIQEEWLYEIGEEETCIFLRSKDDSGKIEFYSDFVFSSQQVENRFNVYVEDFESGRMDKQLFLSDIVSRSSEEEDFAPYQAILKWFKKLILIFPHSKFISMMQYIDNNLQRKSLESYLKYFDTGITQVEKREMKLGKLLAEMNEDEREHFNQIVSDSNLDKGVLTIFNYDDSLYELEMRDGELMVSEMVSSHGNDEDKFTLEHESDGTRRLFDLLPVLSSVLSGAVVVIDELDRSLHSKATIEFIKQFYKVVQDNNAQLIATTHDINVLDLSLLRQDEIWFIERGKDQGSCLYSLDQFKARFDKRIDMDYLLGKYGAVPVFNQLFLNDQVN